MILTQCKSITKKGNRCKREAVMTTGHCVKHWHKVWRMEGKP